MEEFDKYLKGEMAKEERERFEQRLAEDEAIRTELELHEGLRQLRWKQKTKQVANARKEWQKRRFRRLLFYGLMFVFGLLVMVVVYKKISSAESEVQNASDSFKESDSPAFEDIKTQKKAPSKEKKPKYQGPIADGGELNQFDIDPNSGMRSVYTQLDSLSMEVLDTLFLRTIQFLPQPVDKNWSKAVEQLTKGKPQVAKPYIFALEKTDPKESKWLLALALLGEGRNEEAINILRAIAQDSTAPRTNAATRALELLDI